jgi:hypothetical protein
VPGFLFVVCVSDDAILESDLLAALGLTEPDSPPELIVTISSVLGAKDRSEEQALERHRFAGRTTMAAYHNRCMEKGLDPAITTTVIGQLADRVLKRLQKQFGDSTFTPLSQTEECRNCEGTSL